jgi:lipopolysaccharide transport system ATP-binding protein
MTSQIILNVENISKKYVINHQNKIDSFRELLGYKLRQITNRLTNNNGVNESSVNGDGQQISKNAVSKNEEFWALKDVSFTVNAGERVGVIGRNGAGKSTLLKILSRVTNPTHGTITAIGKITSLLEIGTGFHPDLTGRENIYLNGSIMGMTKEEIKEKFDQIVEFSEIEKFLDTPVKHYSSGMHVRLAFSVVAHLTPDILILDEVLAVGDHKFQQKCVKRMEEINASGCTVIFVSHSLDAIEKYCRRAILLSEGSVFMDTNDMKLALDAYKQM